MASFPETPLKQLLRETHVEAVYSSRTGREEYWLFDYRDRDPLTGNAAVRQLKDPCPAAEKP